MSNKKSKLIIGISSRALFNLDESHEIYKKQGLKSYQDYQIEKISQKVENFGKIDLDFVNFNETYETYAKKSILSKIFNFPKMLMYYKQ